LLFDDILTSTLGKVSYQFVDIDQQPLAGGRIWCGYWRADCGRPALDGEGNPSPILSQPHRIRLILATFQHELVGYITTQNLQGNFGAYFVVENNGGVRLDTTDGSGMTYISDDLRTVFGYSVVQGTLAQYQRQRRRLHSMIPRWMVKR
jgi:hypothetical protein